MARDVLDLCILCNPSCEFIQISSNILFTVNSFLVRSDLELSSHVSCYWGHPYWSLWSNIYNYKVKVSRLHIFKNNKNRKTKLLFSPPSSKSSPFGSGMSRSPWKLVPLYDQSPTMLSYHLNHTNKVGL